MITEFYCEGCAKPETKSRRLRECPHCGCLYCPTCLNKEQKKQEDLYNEMLAAQLGGW